VGYEIDKVKYWIATSRYNLSGEQIARASKLRWDIENFFAWWKRQLKVCHLIARSAYGLMVQILAGLITYLLLAIYCHKHFLEKELVFIDAFNERKNKHLYAKIEPDITDFG
jgi:IS4 transposase